MPDTERASWQPAVSPRPALPAGSVRTYKNAHLTRTEVTRSADASDAVRYVTGAVYADGDLVAASVRSGGHRGDVARADDPPRVDAPRDAERLRGTWLYGGNWMGQFGHFVTETLTTLWPLDRELVGRRLDGIVFHRFIFPTDVAAWQKDLVTMAGWSPDLKIKMVWEPLTVDRLVVPTRPFVLNQCAGPEAALVWRRVGSAVTPLGRPVFLSRSALADDPRRLPGDAELDAAMAGLGLDVVRPETLSVREQVAAVAQAPVVVAVSGSHLHLTAFAGAGTRVVEIGDLRTGRAPVPNQRVVDAACGHLTAFVPLVLADPTPGAPPARDTGATVAAVQDLLDAR